MTQRRPGSVVKASRLGAGPRTTEARSSERRINLPALSPTAESAHLRLGLAIAATFRPTPCAGSDDWLSEAAEVRAAAAESCTGCQVLSLCAQYADAAPEACGVWGGVDRTPAAAKRGRPRTRKSA
ncbi:WhiB family transcriptional regulator [Nakamurella sp. PAMC28650]|uniref:WhiB family transcriptional regulator n=1 Tax=Nakamurella sp. PAMC28650 TaxID=2762325 RepID=UPI00164DB306|nr:WhiB family transcriptional regulator [Nakamurella sp. PAMC28650]